MMVLRKYRAAWVVYQGWKDAQQGEDVIKGSGERDHHRLQYWGKHDHKVKVRILVARIAVLMFVEEFQVRPAEEEGDQGEGDISVEGLQSHHPAAQLKEQNEDRNVMIGDVVDVEVDWLALQRLPDEGQVGNEKSVEAEDGLHDRFLQSRGEEAQQAVG